MADPEITVDIVDDSNYSYLFNGTQMVESGVRIANVRGVGKGVTGTKAAADAYGVALKEVQKKYPIRSAWPNGYGRGIIFGYRAMGISQADDAIKIGIVYDTVSGNGSPPGGDVQPFVVSDDTSTISDTTDMLRNDVTGSIKQILVWWQDPNNKKINKCWPGTITQDATLRTVIASGIVLARNLRNFRQYANFVNRGAWNDLPQAFWKLSVIHTQTSDLGRSYNLSLQAVANTSHDWSQYLVARDLNTGVRVRVDPGGLKTLQGLAYQPFEPLALKGKNIGCIRACPYNWVNFRSIFGFG